MNKKIVRWFEVRDELSKAKLYPGFSFQVWCQINEEKIQKVLNEVMKKSEPSEAFLKYKKQSDDLVNRHCKKDELGAPIFVNDANGRHYQFEGQDAIAIKEAIGKLNEEHADIIEANTKMLQEYFKWINEEEIEIDIKLLNKKHLPLDFFREYPKESASFITRCLDLTTYQEGEEE